MSNPNPNERIPFVRAPQPENAEASIKRLNGYGIGLTNFMASHKRRSIIELLLKLSCYRFWRDSSEDFAASSVADPIRQLAASGATYGIDISAAARELLDRWDAGDMQPRLLQTPLTTPASAPAPAPAPAHAPAPAPRPAAPLPPPAPAANLIVYSQVHRNNAIFQAMMRGITRAPGKSPRLEIGARPCNIHGHNSLRIGTWWPLLVAVRRDGAHAHVQAGIYGTLLDGTFSIVSCGGEGYDGADNDQGDVLWYSGPLSANADMTLGSQYLTKSQETGRPVRVIRGARGAGSWAPAVGYRYDGLYRVEQHDLAQKRETREEFWRFKLVRLQGQEPLSSVRARSPTPQELAAYWLYQAL